MSCHEPRGAGLYKDSERGVIMGVCAGLAQYFDLNKFGVRVAAGLCLLFMFWPTLIAYVVAGVMLRERPLSYCGRDDERNFWRHNSRHY